MIEQLDAADLKILRLLQANGNMVNTEIAAQINVSPSTCYRRTQRLLEGGYIRGVHANIANDLVGMENLAIIGVVLHDTTPPYLAAFEDAVRQLRFILDCHLVAGQFDYIIKIRARDFKDLKQLIATEVTELPGLQRINSFFAIAEIIDCAAVQF